MSVRKSAGLNQPDSSYGKAATSGFDRFSRGLSGEVPAHGGVRFGVYTRAMTYRRMKSTVRTAVTQASAVTR